MGHLDHDRPDDSNEPRHDTDSVQEEVSATGQRMKGAVKNAAGELINDESLEEKGERENEAGRERQRDNEGFSSLEDGGRAKGDGEGFPFPLSPFPFPFSPSPFPLSPSPFFWQYYRH
jgi:uncharacterized protein YjbJ (UPF0337 family)